jgi:hypothetical protein
MVPAELRNIYKAILYAGATRPEAVGARWRIMHLLGVDKSEETSTFLLAVTKDNSEDKWVRSGAVRSLIEATSFSTSRPDRKQVLRTMSQWISEKDIPSPVLDELRQAGFLASGEGVPEGWYEDYLPILDAGAEKARSQNAPELEKAWVRNATELAEILGG